MKSSFPSCVVTFVIEMDRFASSIWYHAIRTTARHDIVEAPAAIEQAVQDRGVLRLVLRAAADSGTRRRHSSSETIAARPSPYSNGARALELRQAQGRSSPQEQLRLRGHRVEEKIDRAERPVAELLPELGPRPFVEPVAELLHEGLTTRLPRGLTRVGGEGRSGLLKIRQPKAVGFPPFLFRFSARSRP